MNVNASTAICAAIGFFAVSYAFSAPTPVQTAPTFSEPIQSSTVPKPEGYSNIGNPVINITINNTPSGGYAVRSSGPARVQVSRGNSGRSRHHGGKRFAGHGHHKHRHA